MLKREECSIAVPFRHEEFFDAVFRLLTDDRLLRAYRQNALQFAQKYTWENVFTKAFHFTLQ